MSRIETLRPLVQLLPAVAVAAAVLVAVPNTRPVLAAVPERLAAAEPAASSAAAEPEPEEPEQPLLPYADGIYTGSSRGYGGPVRVQVTMESGRITDVQILDASHETAAFLKRAKRLLGIVTEAQTWEVDAVSEATYTSRGILGAIRNALTGEEVINPAPPRQPEPEPPVVEEFTAPSAYRDGVYTATAQGFGGPITLQVTVTGDAITDISVVSAEGETRSYFARARHVISEILETGSPEVDAVAGATYSSTGILNAVRSALNAAAVEPVPDGSVAEEEAAASAPEESASSGAAPEESPAPQAADGVYSVTVGDGVTVKVTVTGGQVTDVSLPEGDAETPSFWEKTRARLTALFTDTQPSEAPVLTEQQRSEAVQQVLQQAAGIATPAEAASAPAEEPSATPPETEPVSESAAVLPETEHEEEHPDET